MNRKILICVLALVVILVVAVFYFNSNLYNCREYYELNPIGNGIFIRLLHFGMSCEPAPLGIANSQVCYGEGTQEFGYCQKLGEIESKGSGKVLCGYANLFSLLEKSCEDVEYCLGYYCDSDDEDCRTTNCEYTARDNICCVNTFYTQGLSS
ncbi:MAG: hypothetical protein V1889_01560 [archaeon]